MRLVAAFMDWVNILVFASFFLPSYFCGFFVCKEHSKKRREDPSKSTTTTGTTIQSNASSMTVSTSSAITTNTNTPTTNQNNNTSSLNISDNTNNEYEKKNFKRICDVCEDKYLKWQINFAF